MPFRPWAAVSLVFVAAAVGGCNGPRSRPAPAMADPAAVPSPARSGTREQPPPAGASPTASPGAQTSPASGARGKPAAASQTEELGATSALLEGLPPTASLHLTEVGQGAVQGAAVVTSVEAQATQVGIDILAAGGNAVDAAVATAFALAVTHPSAGNIGGGGFALVRLGDRIEAIDFREDAPRGLTRQSFDELIRRGGRGPLAVGVPGTVAGLHLLHQGRGLLPWAQVMAGAIRLADDGARVGLRQSQTFTWAKQGLKADPEARRVFFPRGRAPAVGQKLRQPELAATLRQIAAEGPAGFYQGPVAASIVQSLKEALQREGLAKGEAQGEAQPPRQPGPAKQTAPLPELEASLITLDDLAAYRARLRTPLWLDYHGARIVTMPPPSAGGATLLLNLSMLDALDASKEPANSAARLHLLIEASRRAQVERRLLLSAPERALAADQDLQERVRTAGTWLDQHPISLTQATRSATLHPLYEESLREVEHTTHLSVVDSQGNAVSLTVTLSGSFGAQIVTTTSGIVLNNAAASFGTVGRNVPEAGVRTMSSMAPTLVLLSPRDLLVLGSPGGDTIPSTMTALILDLVDDRLSLAAAVKVPRLHQGFVPDEVSMERLRPLPPRLVTQLEALGHTVKASRSTIGDANIAAYLEGRALAVYDPREGGLAASIPAPAPQTAPAQQATPAPSVVSSPPPRSASKPPTPESSQ